MTAKSYDYENRTGLRNITWEDFGNLTRQLAEILENEHIELVVGIARAGLFPATAVACMLRKELIPAQLSRRLQDKVVRDHPAWNASLPQPAFQNKVVGIIDEIADTGETLFRVKEEVQKRHAKRIVTSSLITHTWADPKPDYSIIESDALILFPWDHQVLINRKWQTHPELKPYIPRSSEP